MDKFEEVLPLMTKIPIFADFDVANENDKRILHEVYNSFSIKNFKKGDIIIKEGDVGDIFYILYKGKVEVYRYTLSGDRLSLAFLTSDMNIFFGENALIGQDTRSASIVASTDCSTITLSGDKFEELCQREPIFGYRVLLRLARQLKKTVGDLNKDKAVLYSTLFDEIEQKE